MIYDLVGLCGYSATNNNSFLYTRAVGKHRFFGLLQYIQIKYHIVICFFNTGLLTNMLGLGIQVRAHDSILYTQFKWLKHFCDGEMVFLHPIEHNSQYVFTIYDMSRITCIYVVSDVFKITFISFIKVFLHKKTTLRLMK